MDYFENVVIDYLRADRALFVNTQCCIQLNDGDNPDTSGPHWYSDAVAVDFRNESIFLCEITFSKSLDSLLKRISGWNTNWSGLCRALVRDSHLPDNWPVRPWVFVPSDLLKNTVTKLDAIKPSLTDFPTMPIPRVTPLENVLPWAYTSWNRKGIKAHDSVPERMR